MNLFMTLLVRDEADIVAANLSYHLSRGVDHIIVTNNRSVDDTREILQEFERAGQITLIDEDEDDFSQFRWVTRMARLAQKMGADWVINNDADEMWWPVEGDLKSVLAAVPPLYGCVTVERMNALPLRSLSGHPFAAMRFREVHSVNGLGQRLPPKVAHRAVADVCVQQGNHCALAPSLGPSVSTSRIVIHHFPYRSYRSTNAGLRAAAPLICEISRCPGATVRFAASYTSAYASAHCATGMTNFAPPMIRNWQNGSPREQ